MALQPSLLPVYNAGGDLLVEFSEEFLQAEFPKSEQEACSDPEDQRPLLETTTLAAVQVHIAIKALAHKKTGTGHLPPSTRCGPVPPGSCNIALYGFFESTADSKVFLARAQSIAGNPKLSLERIEADARIGIDPRVVLSEVAAFLVSFPEFCLQCFVLEDWEGLLEQQALEDNGRELRALFEKFGLRNLENASTDVLLSADEESTASELVDEADSVCENKAAEAWTSTDLLHLWIAILRAGGTTEHHTIPGRAAAFRKFKAALFLAPDVVFQGTVSAEEIAALFPNIHNFKVADKKRREGWLKMLMGSSWGDNNTETRFTFFKFLALPGILANAHFVKFPVGPFANPHKTGWRSALAPWSCEMVEAVWAETRARVEVWGSSGDGAKEGSNAGDFHFLAQEKWWLALADAQDCEAWEKSKLASEEAGKDWQEEGEDWNVRRIFARINAKRFVAVYTEAAEFAQTKRDALRER